MAELWRRGLRLATNQIEFSLLRRSPETGGLLAACAELGVVPLAYSPIGQGRLTGKYSAANPPPGKRTFSNHPDGGGRRRGGQLRTIGEKHGGKTPSQVALNWVMAKGRSPSRGPRTAAQAQENAGALGWSHRRRRSGRARRPPCPAYGASPTASGSTAEPVTATSASGRPRRGRGRPGLMATLGLVCRPQFRFVATPSDHVDVDAGNRGDGDAHGGAEGGPGQRRRSGRHRRRRRRVAVPTGSGERPLHLEPDGHRRSSPRDRPTSTRPRRRSPGHRLLLRVPDGERAVRGPGQPAHRPGRDGGGQGPGVALLESCRVYAPIYPQLTLQRHRECRPISPRPTCSRPTTGWWRPGTTTWPTTTTAGGWS
jgi:hypothetical protein